VQITKSVIQKGDATDSSPPPPPKLNYYYSSWGGKKSLAKYLSGTANLIEAGITSPKFFYLAFGFWGAVFWSRI